MISCSPACTGPANHIKYFAWFWGLIGIKLLHKILQNPKRRQSTDSASICWVHGLKQVENLRVEELLTKRKKSQGTIGQIEVI